MPLETSSARFEMLHWRRREYVSGGLPIWNREEVFHAVLPHVLCRAGATATTIVLTIPAVTIYVNLGFEVASRDAIAEEGRSGVFRYLGTIVESVRATHR
jgi:hypothetical protein